MREEPTVISNDKDIIASAVEYRPGAFNRGDWYVTWVSRDRPWEVSCTRLSQSDTSGSVSHHGRRVEYRIHWHVNLLAEEEPVADHEWKGAAVG